MWTLSRIEIHSHIIATNTGFVHINIVARNNKDFVLPIQANYLTRAWLVYLFGYILPYVANKNTTNPIICAVQFTYSRCLILPLFGGFPQFLDTNQFCSHFRLVGLMWRWSPSNDRPGFYFAQVANENTELFVIFDLDLGKQVTIIPLLWQYVKSSTALE